MVQIVLSDYNCEGHAKAIFNILKEEGLDVIAEVELRYFADVGLSPEAKDDEVWRVCQSRGYLLLTANRTGKDEEEALEFVIRRRATADSLPVLTLTNRSRILSDRQYRLRVAVKIAEIVLDLENYRGVTRLYLPGHAEVP